MMFYWPSWSLTYPALIHCCLALLAALVQLVIAPLPVSILRLVQVATGAWDSPHLDTEPQNIMSITSVIVFIVVVFLHIIRKVLCRRLYQSNWDPCDELMYLKNPLPGRNYWTTPPEQ